MDGKTYSTRMDMVYIPTSDWATQCLSERKPILMGMSPGNPYYYKEENLLKMIKFANKHTDCVGSAVYVSAISNLSFQNLNDSICAHERPIPFGICFNRMLHYN